MSSDPDSLITAGASDWTLKLKEKNIFCLRNIHNLCTALYTSAYKARKVYLHSSYHINLSLHNI